MLQIEGKIIEIYPTQQVSDKFSKREFVVEIIYEINGNNYTNYAKFQTVQAKTILLDQMRKGDTVKVNFNIKGNRWEKDGKVNYITTLYAWRIEKISGAPVQSEPYNDNYNPKPDNADDLPF